MNYYFSFNSQSSYQNFVSRIGINRNPNLRLYQLEKYLDFGDSNSSLFSKIEFINFGKNFYSSKYAVLGYFFLRYFNVFRNTIFFNKNKKKTFSVKSTRNISTHINALSSFYLLFCFEKEINPILLSKQIYVKVKYNSSSRVLSFILYDLVVLTNFLFLSLDYFDWRSPLSININVHKNTLSYFKFTKRSLLSLMK